ncbi:MAG TPA: hypothetical protein VFO38_03790 [Candidatus Saccharimonadales bacterium]|nr:hypothetical protein [Candidatus Saccharimonadales bacterium]
MIMHMPNWLRNFLRYDQAKKAFDDTCSELAYLWAALEAADLIARTSYADPQQHTTRKVLKDCEALLVGIDSRNPWSLVGYRKQLQAYALQLPALQMELLELAQPKLGPFVAGLLIDCNEIYRRLLLLQRKGWQIMPALNLVSEVRKLVSEMNTERPQAQDLANAFRAFIAGEQASEAAEALEAVESVRSDIRQFLANFRREHPKRKKRLAGEFAHLKGFSQECASWKDLQQELDTATALLEGMRKQFSTLQSHIDKRQVVQAATLKDSLEADWTRIKTIFADCRRACAARRQQISDACSLTKSQVGKMKQLAQEPGTNPDGADAIKSFAGEFQRAVKDDGDLLTVQAVTDQAGLIVQAVAAFCDNPTQPVVVAVHPDFAALDGFPA